jgi:hypothetical protein
MSTDNTVSPLRQRMIEDMRARKLGPYSQRSHIKKGTRTGTSCCHQSCFPHCDSGGRYARHALTQVCRRGSVGYFLAVGKVSSNPGGYCWDRPLSPGQV